LYGRGYLDADGCVIRMYQKEEAKIFTEGKPGGSMMVEENEFKTGGLMWRTIYEHLLGKNDMNKE
jgi:hypothetical protein